MKKIILITSFCIVLFTSFVITKHFKKGSNKSKYTIGILQTASHPALDASRDGFIEELTNKLGDSVKFITHNAQGSITQAHALAQQISLDKNYSGFFTIATPATQAMNILEKERPIFVAAVTDPDALGLVHPTTNVCGVRDMIDVKAEIEMMIELIPTIRTVGLIYTSGEINSISLIKKMRQELEAHQLTAIDFAISNESDLQAAVELACRKVDIILAPTDHTIASSITLIASLALKNKKPLIVSDNMLIAHGALASRGVDYKASGKRVAELAYEVITGEKKPYELPIEQSKSPQIFINKKTLEALKLTVPEVLKKFVVFIS